jgi:hypothetical protein
MQDRGQILCARLLIFREPGSRGPAFRKVRGSEGSFRRADGRCGRAPRAPRRETPRRAATQRASRREALERDSDPARGVDEQPAARERLFELRTGFGEVLPIFGVEADHA